YPPVVRGQRRVGARSQDVRYAEARRRGHEVFRRVLRPGQRQGAQEKRVRIATSLQREGETSLCASHAARLGRDAPLRLGAGRLASHRSLSMSDFAAARWISAEAVARLSRPTASAIGLPRELYTSPEFFELERDRVLAGIPLLLLRDRAGTVRAFHNVCSHRGVQLVAEPRNTRGGITCPYHAWTYGLDGALQRRPWFCGQASCPDDQFDAVALGLKPVRCESWHQLLFVNLDGKASPLAEYVLPLAERWADRDLSLLRHGGSLRFEIHANWKLVVENFCERYHLPSVHPKLNSYSAVDHSFQIIGDGLFSGVGSSSYAPPAVGPFPLPGFPAVTAERR